MYNHEPVYNKMADIKVSVARGDEQVYEYTLGLIQASEKKVFHHTHNKSGTKSYSRRGGKGPLE